MPPQHQRPRRRPSPHQPPFRSRCRPYRTPNRWPRPRRNTWWSNPGVLTVTFALPTRDRIPPQELPLIAGLAVREIAAHSTGKSHILLKWPNDILHDNQKLAGLLCERVNNVDLIAAPGLA